MDFAVAGAGVSSDILFDSPVASILLEYIFDSQKWYRWSYCNADDVDLRVRMRSCCKSWDGLVRSCCRELVCPRLSSTPLMVDFIRFVSNSLPCVKLIDMSWCCIGDITQVLTHPSRELHGIKARFCGTLLLQSILKNSPSLQILDISGSVVESESVSMIGDYCPQLTELHLHHINVLNDSNLASICKLKHLRVLDLSDSPGVTSDAVIKIVSSCHNLRWIDLTYFSGTVQGVKTCAQSGTMSCQQLHCGCRNPVIENQGCPVCGHPRLPATEITDQVVETIAQSCPDLEFLSVRGRDHVTVKSLEVLIRKCKKLTELDISWCQGITDYMFVFNMPVKRVDYSFCHGLDHPELDGEYEVPSTRTLDRERIGIGDRLWVLDTCNRWYHCRVIDVRRAEVMVHYDGWSKKWWEWIPTDSPRIVPKPDKICRMR